MIKGKGGQTWGTAILTILIAALVESNDEYDHEDHNNDLLGGGCEILSVKAVFRDMIEIGRGRMAESAVRLLVIVLPETDRFVKGAR